MITEQDLMEAIAECQGQRYPNSSTCIKLAAYYTIRTELFGRPERVRENEPRYSFAAAPHQKTGTVVVIDSGTEFARVIDGKEQERIWPVLDELMDTLGKIQPRLYQIVLEKLQ